MLNYDRTDASEGIDANKTIKHDWKKWNIVN